MSFTRPRVVTALLRASLFACVVWGSLGSRVVEGSVRTEDPPAPATPPATTSPPAKPTDTVETIPTEPNPEASAALAALSKAYRERPSLRVREEVVVTAARDGQESEAAPRSAEMMFAPDNRCVFASNGFELRYSEGKVWATHDSNPDAYLEAGDDDSPYWSLVSAFTNLPFISLALCLGEHETQDLVMQLHPHTPNVIPASVTVKVAADGTKRQHIVLLANGERLELVVDPSTMLVTSVEARVAGGGGVPPNGSLTYRTALVSEIPKTPFEAAAFRLEPGKRTKVDRFDELRRQEARRADSGGGALVGKPAPDFSAVLSDGGFVKSDDLLGRVVVLDFWATWCGPCRQALPELDKLAAWAKAEGLPVVIYPFNVLERTQGEERLQQVVNTLQLLKVGLPTLLDDNDKARAAFDVRGIPASVVIRSDGIVHAQHVGVGDDYLEMLKADIRAAIEAVSKSGAATNKAPASPSAETGSPPASTPNGGASEGQSK